MQPDYWEEYRDFRIRIREVGGFTGTVFWGSSQRRHPKVFSASREEGRSSVIERCKLYIDEAYED